MFSFYCIPKGHSSITVPSFCQISATTQINIVQYILIYHLSTATLTCMKLGMSLECIDGKKWLTTDLAGKASFSWVIHKVHLHVGFPAECFVTHVALKWSFSCHNNSNKIINYHPDLDTHKIFHSKRKGNFSYTKDGKLYLMTLIILILYLPHILLLSLFTRKFWLINYLYVFPCVFWD